MQTFLPYADLEQSARVLDYRRLGKQRVECLQILQTLTGTSKGWQNHPAVKMWRGHEDLLQVYGIAVCEEWIRRGYKDTCLGKIEALHADCGANTPAWWGNEDFHKSHQSNLLRKAPEHYGQFFRVSPDLPYVWPV